MKFVDEVSISVSAGRGGDGCVSFHRGPNLPKGGPDGGNGGRGGDIVLQGREALNTLVDFRFKPQYQADKGRNGGSQLKTGASGKALVLDVPCGTSVVDQTTLELIADITQPDQRVIVAVGGDGGRGNHSFRSSKNQSPRQFNVGLTGESKQLRLQLKVLADVGLLGKPNAGKSTLLSVVSASKPRIADYPFTTLTPNLGVVDIDATRSFVMADVPGLIEGAASGHGLGTRFLKHLSRTALMLHLIEVSPVDGSDPITNLVAIEEELAQYSHALAQRSIWTVLTKNDLISDDALEALSATVHAIRPERPVFCISAVTHHGVNELMNAISNHVAEHTQVEASRFDDLVAQDAIHDMMKRSPTQKSDSSEESNNDEVEVICRRD